MKDWKFIQVGNMKTDAKAKELFEKMMDAKEIAENWGRMSSYHKEDISSGLKVAKDAYLKAKREYEEYANSDEHVKNESIDKQEWSMFKGLTKNAESEVGNEDIPTEQDLKNWIRMSQQDMKDAQREMEKNKPLGHPDSYREEMYGRAKVKYDEAAKAIKKMEEELRQGKYKKVGNKAIYDDSGRFIIGYVEKNGNGYSAYTHGITGSKSYLLDAKDEKTAEAELKDYVKAYEKRKGNKVGNKFKLGDYVIVTLPGGKRVWGRVLKDDGNVIKYMQVDSNGDEFGPERVATPSEVKAENKKTGNTNWKQTGSQKWETELPNGSKIVVYYEKGEMSDWNYQIDHKKSNTYIGSWARDKQEAMTESVERAKRLGNSKYGSKEDIISHLDTDLYDIHKNMGGKDRPIFFYVSGLQKKGYDMGTISKFIKDIGKTVERLKTGNAQTYINGEWKDTKSPKEQLIEYAKKSNDPEYLEHVKKMTNPNDINARLQWHKKSGNETLAEYAKSKPRIINETKAERKFGKVMGEFEEGSLKTPQGKTVTDPAQAKAIAYSEADKVDNLKRARNAMAKNKQITLWDGNDSVLISEDGTVKYLESNSFEVGRDKYDSQQKAVEELTKQGYRKK